MTKASAARYRKLAQVGPWLGSAAVLIGAWFIVDATPTRSEKRSSFDVYTTAPDWGVGRNIRARVVGATFADEVADQFWSARGNWFLIQIEAEAVDDGTGASLGIAELSIDGVVYESTDRTGDTIRGMPLLVGVPLTGVLAFELPDDLTTGTAEVRLGVGVDQRLDSIIVVPLQLAEMTRVPIVTIFPPAFATPPDGQK